MFLLLEGGLEVLFIEMDDVTLYFLPAGLWGWWGWGLIQSSILALESVWASADDATRRRLFHSKDPAHAIKTIFLNCQASNLFDKNHV